MGTPARSLPAEFAIFPLEGAVMLPGGRLPLNIFERRYLNMVEDALGSGRMLGMIQPDAGRTATPNGPGLYKVGCLGRITSFSETEDKRFLITLTGLCRFAVAVELEMQRGYRRVRADLGRFARDLEPEPEQIDRETLLQALRTYFQARGFDANWEAIDEMPDGPLVSALSMVCPFEPAEKQVLLEADSTSERGRTLLALLEIGAHTTDAGESVRKLS